MAGYELHDFAPMAFNDSAVHLENFLMYSKGGEEIMFDDVLDESSSPEEPPTPYAHFLELGTSSTQPQLGYTLIDLSSPTSSFQEPGTSSTQHTFIDLSSPTSSFHELADPGPSSPQHTLVDIPSPTSTFHELADPGPSSPKTDINPVEVLHPPPSEAKYVWMAKVASMLPRDILRRAPRKRGEGKYACSGMKYKPCTHEEFIAKVDEKIRSGKYKAPVAKRPRLQRVIGGLEGTVTDPVVVALQAQAEIYSEHFNGAANYFDRE